MIACFIVFFLISLCQYEILQKNQQQKRLQLLVILAPPRYRYRPPIPYNPIACFTFVDIPNILCYHLTQFTSEEIACVLPLLGLHKIRFQNRYQATPEEAFAVILIRLSYSTRYWALMDQFGHSRS